MNILMLPYQAGKPWNGATIYQEPLGGSESAVAYLARAFSRKGHQVTVVTHGTGALFDGVNYVPREMLVPLVKRDWDVVISSRWPEILNDAPWQAKLRLLWLHDLPPQQLPPVQAHRAVLLSEFHARAYQFPAGDYSIIGNGVDIALFSGPEVPRNENKLVWTSNPDRGLAVAAHIFQDIRKSWPQLELHVYGRASVYGWGLSAEGPYMPRLEDQENVFIHEPLPKAALAKVLKESWAWFYPTFWMETFCIAALEAQAAGTPVISVPLGALEETVRGGILQYDFKNAISQLRNKSKWKKESEEGKEAAKTQDWEIIAGKWLRMIEELEARYVEQPQPS